MIRDYLLERGDVGSQYRIKENAFAHFEPGRTTARDILQVVSANQECPASNYTAKLDISPLDGSGPRQRTTWQSSPSGARPSEAARNSLLRAWQYQAGQGVAKDPLTAARLYENAAKQGLPDFLGGTSAFWVEFIVTIYLQLFFPRMW